MREGGIHGAVVRSPAVTIVRRARACSLPPGPHPGPDRQRYRPPLPLARHQALSTPPYLLAPIIVLFTPARSSASLSLPPPLPLDSYNDADNQRSVDAARDLLPEDDRLRAAQSASLSSPPPRAEGCVRGAEHQRPVTPGIAQPLGQVPPYGCPSLLKLLSGASAGGEHP